MRLSYWEYKQWLNNIDFTIVGSGIVGLCTAMFLKERFPKKNIIILEKGIFPQGASTKNAGFACFGSISEILNDLESHDSSEILELVHERVNGLNLLRGIVGDFNIGFNLYGGYEIFLEKNDTLYNRCLDKKDQINKLLYPVFKQEIYHDVKNKFKFLNIKEKLILNKFEGQIDTGMLVSSLLRKVSDLGVKILNNIKVESYQQLNNSVDVKTNNFEFITKNLILTTNGFTNTLIPLDIIPARSQVLITYPIQDLRIKGTFHLDSGYYYFRNIDNRILIGGGRNLDFKTENTSEFGLTKKVQDELNKLLKEVILPDYQFEIDKRWSGIMGVGAQKKPIINQFANNVFVGARMGGMGVAIGCSVGKKLSDIIYQ
jgi:glycine/D-amino acid oxidase-like deaminating enzyme